MMTQAERDQLLAGYALHMELTERGVACGIDSRPDDAPAVRVAGIEAVEAIPNANGTYDIWEVGEATVAPLGVTLSLDEVAALLSQSGAGA